MLKFGSKHDSNIVHKCTVRLMEDTDILECEYKPNSRGKFLLEYVCQQLNLLEQDYFGLRYVDNADQRHWIDLGKSINKQVKDVYPVMFSFRVKYYPPDPSRLKEEITRYQMFLQLKRDLQHGRLVSTNVNDAAMIMALILQGELGDYDPEIHVDNYVSEYKILLKQTDAIEEKAMEFHSKQLKGQSPSQVENTFLKLVCQLDTYGIDPHSVKDHKGTQLYLGINYGGIVTFHGHKKTHNFRWSEIQKINFEGKMFIIHLNYGDKKHTVGFKCHTGSACRHIWRCAMEQMLFFTLPASSDAPSFVSGGGFFSWGTKFKYSGRTEREILEDMDTALRDEPEITRSSSLRRKASSVPATPSTPLQPHLGYSSSLPRSSHSDVGGSRVESSNSTGLLSGFDNSSQCYTDIAALETVSEDQEGVGGMKLRTTVLKDDSMDRFSDYYVRDSFEHSSSESQLIDTSIRYDASYRSSRSPTPLPVSQVDGREHSATNSHVKKPKKFNIVKAFIPTLILVTLFAILTTVLVLETDLEVFANFKNKPEMISLKYHVYDPVKRYFRKKIPLF